MHLNPSSSIVHVPVYLPSRISCTSLDGPKVGVLQYLIPASFPYALTVGAKARATFLLYLSRMDWGV